MQQTHQACSPHLTAVELLLPRTISLREDNVHVVVEMNEQIMSHHIISTFCVRLGKYLDLYFQSFKVHNFNITLSV